MKKTVKLAFVLVITGLVGYELYERWLHNFLILSRSEAEIHAKYNCPKR